MQNHFSYSTPPKPYSWYFNWKKTTAFSGFGEDLQSFPCEPGPPQPAPLCPSSCWWKKLERCDCRTLLKYHSSATDRRQETTQHQNHGNAELKAKTTEVSLCFFVLNISWVRLRTSCSKFYFPAGYDNIFLANTLVTSRGMVTLLE